MVPTTSHPSTAILYFYLLKSNLIDYLFCCSISSAKFCAIVAILFLDATARYISFPERRGTRTLLGSFLTFNPGTYK